MLTPHLSMLLLGMTSIAGRSDGMEAGDREDCDPPHAGPRSPASVACTVDLVPPGYAYRRTWGRGARLAAEAERARELDAAERAELARKRDDKRARRAARHRAELRAETAHQLGRTVARAADQLVALDLEPVARRWAAELLADVRPVLASRNLDAVTRAAWLVSLFFDLVVPGDQGAAVVAELDDAMSRADASAQQLVQATVQAWLWDRRASRWWLVEVLSRPVEGSAFERDRPRVEAP